MSEGWEVLRGRSVRSKDVQNRKPKKASMEGMYSHRVGNKTRGLDLGKQKEISRSFGNLSVFLEYVACGC